VVTLVPSLGSLSSYGETREKALDQTREAILGYLEAAAKEVQFSVASPFNRRTSSKRIALNCNRKPLASLHRHLQVAANRLDLGSSERHRSASRSMRTICSGGCVLPFIESRLHAYSGQSRALLTDEPSQGVR
jgi:predicted RNase H-like HicB family nuclease